MDYYLQCPHCGYEHGSLGQHSTTNYKEFHGSEGGFYKSERALAEGWYYVDLCGCPSCKKTFID